MLIRPCSLSMWATSAARTTDDSMFPAWAKAIEAAKLERYFLLGPTFDASDVRHAFDSALKDFAKGVFDKICAIGDDDRLSYAGDFPKLPDMPEPVEPNPVISRLFGPQGRVRKPGSEGPHPA